MIGQYNLTTEEALDLAAEMDFLDAVAGNRQAESALEWKTPAAAAIEGDYATWLRAVAPKMYAADFTTFHDLFWRWWHATLIARVNGESLADRSLDALLCMGRGLGKSASMEGACVMAGAFLGPILIVYVSSTQDKATEHVQSIRSIIESPNLSRYYPGLSNPRVGEFGNQRGWKAEAVFTDSGLAIVCASLEKGIRGLRDEERRPLILVYDDIDERDDSPKVKKEKFDTLRQDAMPMLAPFGSVLFGQNMIYNGSIMQETWNGKLDWFYGAHKVGIVNTFQDDLDIKKVNGVPRVVKGTPNWTRIGLDEANDMLRKFGEEGFKRECQNLTAPNAEEMVWKKYNPALHVITWDDFEHFFGVRKIPRRWALHLGYDRGYTGWDKHPSALVLGAVASAETPLAGDLFLFYEYITEPLEGVNDIMTNLLRDLPLVAEGDDIEEAGQLIEKANGDDIPERRAWQLRKRAGGKLQFKTAYGSHEGKHERDTFANDWGVGVEAGDANKTSGLQQLWTKLEPEEKPHPFYPHLTGRPNVFLVVAPEQKAEAKDRWGLRRLRQEAENLTFDPNVTSRDVPTKFGDDATDACFVAGTLIRTAEGEKPIEQIRVGDMIWTRQGLRRVREAGETNSNAAVYTMQLSDSTTLTGTASHPIFIQSRKTCRVYDWIQLKLCLTGDMVYTWKEHQNLLNLMGCGITDTRTQNKARIAITIKRMSKIAGRVIARCMSPFGRTPTAKYRLGVRFITRTGIRWITDWKTLNVSLLMSIYGTMSMPAGRLLSRQGLPDWNAGGMRRQLGIRPMRGASGISNMQSRADLDSNQCASLLVSGAESLSRVVRRAPAFALRYVIAAGNKALKSSACKANALFVASQQRTSRETPPYVPREVAVTSITEAGRAKVYNLSVDDCPEYFANGVLVHNCKFITQTFSLSAGDKTPSEKVEENLPSQMQRENVRQFLTENQSSGWIALRREVEKVVKENHIRPEAGSYEETMSKTKSSFRSRFSRRK